MRKLWIPFLLTSLLLTGTACAEIENDARLVINQEIELSAGENAEFSIVEGEDLAVLEGSTLRALATGDVTVEAKVGDDVSTKVFTITPYTRICGAAEKTNFAGPVCVWVDFNAATSEIAHIEIVGMGQPDVLAGYGEEFAALQSERLPLCGRKADEVAADDTLTDALGAAVQDACKRFLDPAAFTIRPYQSMAVDRYLANNPHFDDRTEDAVIEARVVAAYPENCLVRVEEDVVKNENSTWKNGVIETKFKNGETEYTVSHNAMLAKAPGMALVEYSFDGKTVLDAVEIYDNFTLYPEALSGSDAYGHVVTMPADLTADTLTYRVLGDKAMNFPGGTAGSTIVDVTIDRASRTIADVQVVFSSDSTYLSNAWEYGGNFAPVGEFLYGIPAFAHKIVGMSADTPIVRYTLSDQKANVVGGTVVEGGVDMVVTGATRTPNAVIAAVNAAIEQFVADTAK